jgi:hypothetical protein
MYVNLCYNGGRTLYVPCHFFFHFLPNFYCHFSRIGVCGVQRGIIVPVLLKSVTRVGHLLISLISTVSRLYCD